MTGPHPAAVGSYGPSFDAWSTARTGVPLRWWQRLTAYRILEHDAAGALVWQWWIVSTARQVGKSWLLRELNLWRIHQGELFGEPQLVLHTGKDLPVCREVQRPARAWARARKDEGYTARDTNGMEEIEAPDGSRWMIRGRDSVYGYSASLGVVDEAWKVGPEVVEDGLEPTMAERASPQLGLLSTAHRLATMLVPDRRLAAIDELDEPRDRLILEWSARPSAAIDDRSAWREASPHWTDRRERLVDSQHRRALTAGRSDDPDEPDPVESFRSQWLNIWPERVATVTPGRAVPLLDPLAWDSLVDLGATAPGALTIAVEDHYGRGTGAIAAGRLPDGRLFVWGATGQTRAEVAGWVALTVTGHPGSALIFGPAVDGDAAFAGIPGARSVGTGANTRAGLAAIRTAVATRTIAHDGGDDLRVQMTEAKVVETDAGGLTLSGGRVRSDLVRATAWVVARIVKGQVTPTRFRIR
jgi:hypothetical protein